MQFQYANIVAAAQGPDLDDGDEKEDLQPQAVPTSRPVAQAPARDKKLRKG